jgi:hypothetical protein
MECEGIRDERRQADKMDVLYGEADAEVRARVEAHLAACAACRDEMRALRRVREDLRAWRLPTARPPAFTARPWWLPGRLAAAAALLLAAGAGIGLSGVETGYENGRLFLRLGRNGAEVRRALAAQEARALEQERRQRQEIAALRAALEGRPAATDVSALLARLDGRVDEKVRNSEARQSRRIEATLAEWTERVQAQRRLDLARVAAGLSYLDGQHGEQLARTNELMGYVLEAAAQKR